MPRVADIYQRPAGIDAITNATIDSSDYNLNVADVETDLNTPRPIVAGGTGASNATQARDNLDAEVAGAVVTNYDSHPWEIGSFYAADSASGSPVVGQSFSGIVYGKEDESELVVEARSMTDGRKFIRKRVAGVWGVWASEDADYVNVTGDTMTGPLTITGPLSLTAMPAALIFDMSAGPNAGSIIGRHAGFNRWVLQIPDGSPAADIRLYHYDDSGVLASTPNILIARATGAFNINGAVSATGSLSVGGVIATGGDISGPSANITGNVTANSMNTGNLTATGNIAGATVRSPSIASTVDLGNGVLTTSGNARFYSSNATRSWSFGTVGDHTFWIYDENAAAQRLKLDTSGNLTVAAAAAKPGGGVWADSSDIRIKNVLGSYDHGLAEIMQVQPVRYTFKGNVTANDPALNTLVKADHHEMLEKEFVGVVAQDIEIPMPETVTQVTGWINGEKVEDLRILDASAITFALINAVKEMAARIEALEAAQATP